MSKRSWRVFKRSWWVSKQSWWAGIFTILAIAAIALRVIGFNNGWFYGDEASLYANVAIAGLLVVAATCFAGRLARNSSSGSLQPGSAIAIAGSVIGLGAAALGVVQVLVPTKLEQAAAPACRGVPVAGAPFLGQTTPSGVNARAGAGTGFEQVNRFGGDCTLGFDGYCIGESIKDKVTGIDDVRWLIVYKQNYLVSSAEIQSQSKETDLGGKPSADCGKYGGYPEPGTLKFTAKQAANQQIALEVKAPETQLVGYAIRILNPAEGGYPYSLIGIKNKNDTATFSAKWTPSTAAPYLSNGTGQVELVANACLAAAIPSGTPSVYLATLKSGQVVKLQPSSPREPRDSKRLAQTACSGAPG